MNLPFINRFKKEILPSYFLVLVLRDQKVNAVIFQEISGRVKIVGQKEEYFSSSIDEVDSEEFLQTLDKAISHAESSLPENVQTQKTIFGVKDSWTDNDQIKKEYLAKLKKASEELGLTPIGFLVVSQAISHLLQKEEGAPISAILIEVNKKSVTVTLIRAGKIIETKSSEIHESIPFTVDTVLKHFNIPEILPSRIIIFNGQEDLSQEFIGHTWSKSLPFLHFPQITNLPSGFDARSVLFGAATQMGFEVLETSAAMQAQKNEEIQNFSPSADGSEKLDSQAAKEEVPIKEVEHLKYIETENFGFVKDIDVAKIPATSARNTSQIDSGEDISQIHQEEVLPLRTKHPKSAENILMLTKNILISILSVILIFAKKIDIKKILSILTKMPKGRPAIIIPAILFLVIIIASYFFFIKATIEIAIDPKIIEQHSNILFSTISKTDSGSNTIQGEFVTVSYDGTASTSTTGKKDVGTKAKGTVTIYNDSDIPRNLTQGTILEAPNGLEFTLDSSTNVKAVASHSANENPPPEKTTANVTANQLGKESNLPSGTKFTVGSLTTSIVIAINDNPFSGGTKKEVTVVSKEDQSKLEEELPKQLEDKAKESLTKQIGQDKVLLSSFISKTLAKKSLNVKVGDEANQVTLTGTVEFQGISYRKSDLISFSKSLLEKDVPNNQQINYNNIKTEVLDIKNKNDDEIEANLNIKALILPKLDEVNLTKEIKGKSFKYAEDLLYKLPQISDVNIFLSPQLPLMPKNLPMIEKNIKIKILIDG